jgi:hypothetical protein
MFTHKIYQLPVIIFIISIITGCSIKLVSDYDQNIDKGISDTQIMLTNIISKMRSCARNDTRNRFTGVSLPKDPALIICKNPASTYSPDDYEKIQTQIDTLIIRSESIAHNKITTNALINLSEAILQYPYQYTSTYESKPNKPIMSIQERQQLSSPISLADLNALKITTDSLVKSILVPELAKKSDEKSSSE